MQEIIENSNLLPGFLRNKIVINLISVFLVMVIGKIVLSVLENLIQKFFVKKSDPSKINPAKFVTLSKIFYSIVRVIIIFLVLTVILDIFGVNTSSLIATAGIGGIAIALGAQTLIADFVKGALIIFDDKLRVGEWVICSGVEGEVEEVNLRITKIRDYNGSLHIIPNSNISNVQNFNRGDQKCEVYFKVSNDTKLDDVKDLVDYVSKEIKKVPSYKNAFSKDLKFFEINEFSDFSYKVRVTSTVRAGMQWEISRKIRELIKYEMEKRHIKSSLQEEKGYEKV